MRNGISFLLKQGQLNEEQAYVVETVYNKCLHSSTNLTLIEGPPGKCLLQNLSHCTNTAILLAYQSMYFISQERAKPGLLCR